MSHRKAFVVVDMQNDYCHPNGTYSRHGFNCFSLDEIVPAIAGFASRCRNQGIPIIHLRMAWNVDSDNYPIDAGLIVEQSRPFLRWEGLRRGTWGAELLDEMPPGDYVIEKTRYSGYHNTGLEALLRGLGADTVILAGVVTNVCVEATARDGFHRDFRFVVLRECVSAFSRDLHEASLKTMGIFGRVASLQEAVELDEQNTPRRVIAEQGAPS
jgi:ureidoacrylate peracid hydrolase